MMVRRGQYLGGWNKTVLWGCLLRLCLACRPILGPAYWQRHAHTVHPFNRCIRSQELSDGCLLQGRRVDLREMGQWWAHTSQGSSEAPVTFLSWGSWDTLCFPTFWAPPSALLTQWTLRNGKQGWGRGGGLTHSRYVRAFSSPLEGFL